MPDELFELPAKPFFSCDEDGFVVVDGALMQSVSSVLSIEPVLRLTIGPGNIFERRPLRVALHEGNAVEVACEGEETVYLDFHELTARKSTPSGNFMYQGGIEDGNAGLGFMSMR